MDIHTARSLLVAGGAREGPKREVSVKDTRSLPSKEIVEKFEEVYGNKDPQVFRYGRGLLPLSAITRLQWQRKFKKI